MDYLKIFTSFAEVVENLQEAEIGRLFMAMLKYAASGELSDLRGNERFIWPMAKQNIDREAVFLLKQHENGSKGGRPKTQINPFKPTETQINPLKPTQTHKDKDKDKDNDKIEKISPIGDKKKIPRFSPPSPDEVSAYCRENGYQVDGQSFCDFYTSKGWRVGNQPMKDWQAAVRTWARHDAKPSAQRPVKTVTAQQYRQREYTDDELNAVSGDLIAEARKGASA